MAHTPVTESPVVIQSLYCNRCRARLSLGLSVLPAKKADMPEVGEPVTPRGVALESEMAVPWLNRAALPWLNFTPQLWLNPGDLTDAVTDDPRANDGCCGISGMDGRNQLCRCKAKIGTLQADCILPHVFIPDPGATTMRADTSDHWNYE